MYKQNRYTTPMKIALIGYGKMGKEIEKIALSRGHNIVAIIDKNEQEKFQTSEFRSANVAIEFTSPESAIDNYLHCFRHNVPVVSGTTGWLKHLDEVKHACQHEGQTFFYASNFSIGVNIFFALNNYLARIMNSYPDYDISMKEIHHIHKADAPSGTAITLAESILANIPRKNGWSLTNNAPHKLHIEAIREGEVPGIHEITYTCEIDSITIKHDAKSRKGFALGAVVAAEFTAGKKGFLTMQDMLPF